ncbi:hypothetical protein [Microbacterium sp. BDGP8]|uniref:hypothetical protein n=1 Tax=Microbacterium sp. BDGP8 TaxID=3035531 RepID=UPI00249E56D6|nr:hypothetical protein [Microbacterium sp. BDGP8]WHE37790.1 hypothetical protein P6897_16055 [Microbacterium sp. BDGP8]
MAIKKRAPIDQARIEAFGNAADAPAQSAPAAAEPAAKTPKTAAPRPDKPASGEWPEGTPKTFLVRWGSDPDLPPLLAEVAALEDRTMQKTALRALRRGLEAIRAEHDA